MRLGVTLFALGLSWFAGCATPEDELGSEPDSSFGGGGSSGGFGGAKGGSGGSSASSGSGGSSAFGGSGGSSAFGGSGGLGGAGGSDAGDAGVPDAASDADAGSASGFGDCVTQAEVDSQSSQPFQIGFCFNPFACLACSNDAVKPGDVVCSPKCLCVPLPPICGSDAGSDAGDAGDASDAGDAGDAGDADASG